MGTGHTSQECNVMALDLALTTAGARRLAQDIRVKLWAEHLEMAEADVRALDPTILFRDYWCKNWGRVRSLLMPKDVLPEDAP
jgi:hypothetical protein